MRCIAGISWRQGAHQVAQKLITTIFPRRSLSFLVVPSGAFHSKFGATALMRGAAFGIGMTPCVGPYLAIILNLLLNEDLGSGAFLLFAYALGLGVPFLVIAAGLGGTRRVTDWLRRSIRVINIVGGTLVIVMGLLLVSGQFARLPQLFNFLPLLG